MNLPPLRISLAVLSLACASEALAADAAPAPAPAPAPTATAAATREQRPVLLFQVSTGVLATALATPASIYLGLWLSSLTGSDLGGLPALLLAVAGPPVAATLASWFAGNWGGPERFRWSPAIWVTTGVSLVAFVAAGFLGFNANEPGQVALFTVADAVLLPATAVGMLQWTAAPAQVSLAPGSRLPKVASMPVVRLEF